MKHNLFLLGIILFFFANFATAQTDTSTKTNISKLTLATTSTLKRAQAIYGGILGEGLVFSINYDTRFTKTDKGLGMHAGIGYFGASSSGLMSFPIGLNYLGGKAPNYLELGFGLTFVKLFDVFSKNNTNEGTVMMPTIGYRFQTEKNGFTARFVFTPLFNPKEQTHVNFFGGISFGYKF